MDGPRRSWRPWTRPGDGQPSSGGADLSCWGPPLQKGDLRGSNRTRPRSPMYLFKNLLLLLASTALAGDWSSMPIEPRARPTNTAYTVGARHWQVGLVDQDFG